MKVLVIIIIYLLCSACCYKGIYFPYIEFQCYDNYTKEPLSTKDITLYVTMKEDIFNEKAEIFNKIEKINNKIITKAIIERYCYESYKPLPPLPLKFILTKKGYKNIEIDFFEYFKKTSMERYKKRYKPIKVYLSK